MIRFDDEEEINPLKNFLAGSDLSVKINPSEGYYLTNLILDGKVIEVENYGEEYKYNILNIDKNFKISARFAVKDFVRMYVTQKDNGIISPNSTSLNFGQNQTFTFTPNVGYKIESIMIDGKNIAVTASEGESQSYAFEDVQTDHTIEVNYAIRTFWINVTQSNNGNISPASVIKNYNTTERFYIYPHTGYKLIELIIDGVSQPIENNNGERYEYTFIGIQTNHSISAKFEIRKFTVTFVGNNGEILTTQTINFGLGATAPETITPPEGYHFAGWNRTFNGIYNDLIV